MLTNPQHITWVILAGGRATRMGGQDKGLVTLNGRPLVKHVYDRLAPQLNSPEQIKISANRNLIRYREIADVFSDQVEHYPGPIGEASQATGQRLLLRRLSAGQNRKQTPKLN